MGMNFFERQDVARRKTRMLLLLFIPAVIGVVAVVDIAVSLGYFLLSAYNNQLFGYEIPRYSLSATPHNVLLFSTVVMFVVILGQTSLGMHELRDGGSAIAEAFDARRVDPDTHDRMERQLLNVVEEMAIASGTRVPSVYVLDDEEGLNACAAGHSMSDAIIVVTRGLLDNLDRDELQGVIAHEFSHILNGDMALNTRMIGMLAGIVAIGSFGMFLLRNSVIDRIGSGDAFFTRRGGKDAFLPSLLGGAVMAAIGYTGLFFARLIKAAVAREREYLADAAAVQFTRNPEAVASALEKMRTAQAGTLVRNRYAEEASHMFFGQSFRIGLSNLFATHPPLEKRIKRVMPSFSSMLFQARKRLAVRKPGNQSQPQPSVQPPAKPLAGANIAIVPGGMAGLAGAAANVNAARRLIDSISPYLYQKTRISGSACATVLALMLSPNDEVRSAQLAAARAAGRKSLADAAAALERETRQVAAAMRFPLIDLALPAIKLAAPGLREGLLMALEAAIRADRRMSTHEFVVLTLMRFQAGDKPASHVVKFNALAEVRDDALWLLTLAAYAGCGAASEVERQKEFETAFAAGIREMKLENPVPAARNSFNQQTAMSALSRLRQLAPLKKSQLIQGLFACVMADGAIRVIEAELMRMVCAVLDCPLPPLIEQPDSTAAS